eukprot:CAMPEP_0168561690 /NCGR_PEP_ID=MMETSP0413-20121227/11730_1 /TAXON_ID=136452 /ORGANISM="Filamoeba nolandi, Strain NC-AS-23-1" /LENGTH=210 /DNA_ID=CAMNT_0008593079 /DNA_START=78 /DNA_END=710 /DNA_ORIENTATION=+
MSLQTCESVSSSVWTCLKNNGFSFAIIEAWNGGYQYDKNIANCVSQAWAAGMAHVDVYAFMCPYCTGNNPPSTAVTTLVNNLKSQGVQYGMLWFDIEQCDGCWGSFDTNINFLEEAVNTAVSLGVKVGIYTSEYEWGVTVGSSCTAFKSYPLWYADWDDVPAFDDAWAWEFGGWTTPAIKQYYDQGPCANVDVDYYPSSMIEYFQNYTRY